MENEFNPSEQYANWKAPETTSESEAKLKEKVEERIKQSFSSRLCEYLTGMRPEDPRMAERLITDQKIIRAKYQLPEWSLSPSEFERSLKQIASKLNIRIKPKSECGKFFEDNMLAGAVHFGDGTGVGVDIDRSELQKYWKSLSQLEHELVHGMQDKHSPSMPIELKEYEAYIANANVDYLKENPAAIDEIFFNFFVGGSTNNYYRQLREERKEKIKPEWDNPEFFLQRDGVDLKMAEPQIAKLKEALKKPNIRIGSA